jgi:hypothetical protein
LPNTLSMPFRLSPAGSSDKRQPTRHRAGH